ncbi:MAG TPA: hypothetical protein VGX25_04000 [Actinophytocola sp.]|uniref:hypothetical protein n=1 Tax=Actinophytocola sp. TaxID=1872138 RepID=UPI002DDD838A|nr:hypothetical protein [Actinophytocola sp.]HEV2778541.1 hypothetical protein [Actinophytocola sp.]
MLAPTSYKVLVDWDSDGGLLLGDWERDLDGWTTAATGTTAPTAARSTVRSYHGSGSLLVTWSAGGTLQLVQPAVLPTFVVGRQYTMSAWVWAPSSGGMGALCAVAGVASGVASSATDQWTQITLTFTATATTHQLQIRSGTTPAGGEQTWIDHVQVTGPGEDVTDRVQYGSITIEYGRDQARSLAPITPGRARFDLDNSSRDYSPENASSPLAGLLGPGRDLVVQATHTTLHSMFRGHIDNFEIIPDLDTRLARFTALDGLARLRDMPVSTALYPAVRTGEAVGHLLDAIGWQADRDIDPGATTIRWWWEESDDAYAALQKIVVAEGPGAFAHIGPGGEFVFRDRHHRLVRTASTSVQATFRDTGAAPLHDPPLSVDLGWRDLVNQVTGTVTEREPAGEPTSVWTDPTGYTLGVGQSRTFTVQADNPFWNLRTPTQGGVTDTPAPDFIRTGGTVTVTFNRTSGQAVVMTVRNAGGSAVTVHSMRLRAHPVTTVRTLQIKAEDTTSIQRTRGVRPYRLDTPWLNREDAAAVADLILGQRAERLPVVTFTVVNADSATLTQQLTRDLSDRVHLVDAETGFDDDCYLEQIKHVVSDQGALVTTTLSCEKVPTLPGSVLRFDVAGAGFDDGVFAPTGIDDPTKIFRFDTAGQGFDQGLFAT